MDVKDIQAEYGYLSDRLRDARYEVTRLENELRALQAHCEHPDKQYMGTSYDMSTNYHCPDCGKWWG